MFWIINCISKNLAFVIFHTIYGYFTKLVNIVPLNINLPAEAKIPAAKLKANFDDSNIKLSFHWANNIEKIERKTRFWGQNSVGVGTDSLSSKCGNSGWLGGGGDRKYFHEWNWFSQRNAIIITNIEFEDKSQQQNQIPRHHIVSPVKMQLLLQFNKADSAFLPGMTQVCRNS